MWFYLWLQDIAASHDLSRAGCISFAARMGFGETSDRDSFSGAFGAT